MAQLKKFVLTTTNLVNGRTHTTEVIAASKKAAEEAQYVKLASNVIYGDARGKFRVKAVLVGYVSASGIASKDAHALNAQAMTRAARRKADRAAAAARREAKAAQAKNAQADVENVA